MAEDPRDRALRESQALVQALTTELIGRATPTVGQVTDGLNALTASARQGNAGAQNALKKFTQALDSARDASSALTIIRNGN